MPRRTTAPTAETPVAELWNLSATTADWLNELGVFTYGQLAERDQFELWVELKVRHRQVTKLMFYALWGAVQNCHWNQIPAEVVEEFDCRAAIVALGAKNS